MPDPRQIPGTVDAHVGHRSNNGDTLPALNELRAVATEQMDRARENLRKAEASLQPLRDEVTRTEAYFTNICTRLNVWWNEYRAIEKVPNRKDQVRDE